MWPVCLLVLFSSASLSMKTHLCLLVCVLGGCGGGCHWNGGRRTALDTLRDIAFASDVLDIGGVA